MEKILTLIIPTYNMEKYLDYCLTSLIIDDNELLKQLEVLVVIDGAKDRSSEIAHSYQDRFPETFIVIDKENGNYGSCINRGLKEATGKYIKVLDADDSFDTENFKKYLSSLNNIDVDMVVTDYIIVNEERIKTGLRTRKLCKDTIMTIEDAIEELMEDPIQMHAVTYKRQNLIDIGYKQTEGISYTDQQWIFLPITTVKTLYYKPIVVYKYLVGRIGQTVETNTNIKNISHHIKKNRQTLEWYKQLDHTETIDKFLVKRLTHSYEFVFNVFLLADSKFSMDLNQLREIAAEIEAVPEIYNKLLVEPAHRRIRFRYINYWIKIGKPLKRPLLCTLISKCLSLKGKYYQA